MRFALALVQLICWAEMLSAAETNGGRVDLTTIDRTIHKEPKYEFQPRYGLVVFGDDASHRSWLVMDGNETLYFDRSGDGDLTDPEDRIEFDREASAELKFAEGSSYSGMNAFPIGTIEGCEIKFNYWVRKPSFFPDDERLRKIEEERASNNWEIGTLWRVAGDGSHTQNGMCLTERPDDAQITHIEGPLTFALKWQSQQRIEIWPKSTVFDVHIGTPSLAAKNYKHQVFSPLSITEYPQDIHPIARFELPPKQHGGKTIFHEVPLDQRCCGDTVYAEFTLPREVGSGIAKVTVSYPAWKDEVVHSRSFEVPIEDGISERSELSFIMFKKNDVDIDLKDLESRLEDQGFFCMRTQLPPSECVVVYTDDRLSTSLVAISVEQSEVVRADAKAFGEGSTLADKLSDCDTRLSIKYFDSQKLTSNDEAVSKVRSIVHEATKGILYNSWDKTLVGPN
jgi:hypothetical protein